MYVVTVEFVVRPERAGDFLREMTANATASREREPGCRQFDVCAVPDDPRIVFLYELYDDRAAFDAHVASAHFQKFNAETAAWVERKTARTFLRVDPPPS
jgi:autoinducer 2-degrading protein